MSKDKETKTKRKIPHVYIILLIIVAICAVLTYIVPAGQYDMMEAASGREVVDPDSFHWVENTPVGLLDYLKAVPDGMVETASIIFFIFIVGGSFAVVHATGAVEAAIGSIAKKMQGKERAIIPVIVFAFSILGATYGMAEETLPFIPIMVTLAIALGFDSLTGIGMVLAGAGAGLCRSVYESIYSRCCTRNSRVAIILWYGLSNHWLLNHDNACVSFLI